MQEYGLTNLTINITKYRGKLLMNNFLKYIPGFRSKTKWKMIVSAMYYLYCLGSITQGFVTFIALLAVPFLYFAIDDGIKSHKNKTESETNSNDK